MTTQKRRWILGGGLASGKSQVRKLLAGHGIETIDADAVGHSVLEAGGAAYAEVAGRWPAVVSDGVIDRRALAGIVFDDPAELAALEGMTHPHIFDTIRGRVEEIDGPGIVEMPVISAAWGPEWRRLIVDSRDEEKLGRAVGRGMVERDVKARLASQPTRGDWLAVADIVVPNHGSMDELAESVQELVDRL